MPKEITTANAKARFLELQRNAGKPDAANWNSATVTCINRYLGPTSSYALSATRLLAGNESAQVIQEQLARTLTSILADLDQDEIQVAGETGFFDSYAALTAKLRLWLLTYGLGLVATMVTTKEIFELVLSRKTAWWVIGLVLLGILSQLLIMLVYKFAMWVLYENEYGRIPENKNKWLVRANKVASNVHLELGSDVITMMCLLAASVAFVFGISLPKKQTEASGFWKMYDVEARLDRSNDPRDFIDQLRITRFPKGELDGLPQDAILLYATDPGFFLTKLGYDSAEWKRMELGGNTANPLYVVDQKDGRPAFILNPGLPGAGGITTQVGVLGALGVKRLIHVGEGAVFGAVPARDTLLLATGSFADGGAVLLSSGTEEWMKPHTRFTDVVLQACGALHVPADRRTGFTSPVFFAQPSGFVRMVGSASKPYKPDYIDTESAPLFAMAEYMEIQAASLVLGTGRYRLTRKGVDYIPFEAETDSLKLRAIHVALEAFKSPYQK